MDNIPSCFISCSPDLWKRHIITSWPDMGPVFPAMSRLKVSSTGGSLGPKQLYRDMWCSIHKELETGKHTPEEDEETRLARRFKDVFIRIQVSGFEMGLPIPTKAPPKYSCNEAQ